MLALLAQLVCSYGDPESGSLRFQVTGETWPGQPSHEGAGQGTHSPLPACTTAYEGWRTKRLPHDKCRFWSWKRRAPQCPPQAGPLLRGEKQSWIHSIIPNLKTRWNIPFPKRGGNKKSERPQEQVAENPYSEKSGVGERCSLLISAFVALFFKTVKNTVTQ